MEENKNYTRGKDKVFKIDLGLLGSAEAIVEETDVRRKGQAGKKRGQMGFPCLNEGRRVGRTNSKRGT